jgi:GxGYxYP putative glycoside hydrolase C-terminal domain/GxGYxYP third domain/GxGYxYP_N 1st domain
MTAITFVLLVAVLLYYDHTQVVSARYSQSVNNSPNPFRVPGSPFTLTASPPSELLVAAPTTTSQALLLQSLQGTLTIAKNTPLLYIVQNSNESSQGAYEFWLDDLENAWNVSAVRTFQDDLSALLKYVRPYITSFVIADCSQQCATPAKCPNGSSINAAIAYVSGPARGSVVVCFGTRELDDLIALEIPLAPGGDLRHATETQVWQRWSNAYSNSSLVYQLPAKSMEFLCDFAMLQQAFVMATPLPTTQTLSGTSLLQTVLTEHDSTTAVLGWGTSEIELVGTVSQYHGSFVNAADLVRDLSVFMNLRQASFQQPNTAQQQQQQQQQQHTVTFLFTDGDNIQFLVNSFATDPKWYGSPNRLDAPLGFTLSPAATELVPNVVSYLYRHAVPDNCSSSSLSSSNLSQNVSYFVASPSGVGYAYPSLMSSADLESFATLTSRYMSKADLRIVNVLDETISQRAIDALVEQPNIDAVILYLYSDYSGLHGNITFSNGKPIIGGRYNLWKGFNTPQQLASKLNALPTDPTQTSSYSLIPVHVWSMSVADVLECISLLDSHVHVVTPDQFVAQIQSNVNH